MFSVEKLEIAGLDKRSKASYNAFKEEVTCFSPLKFKLKRVKDNKV